MRSRNRETALRTEGVMAASKALRNEHATPRSDTARPIEPAVRSRFEGGFGRDFSDVRVHAGPEAADTARSLRAQAYTVGTDIHFAAGRYRPDTAQGQQLIGHELAHVAQQARGGSGLADAEARADRAAHHVMQGNTVSPDAVGGAPYGLQAKPDEYGSDAPSGMTFPVTTLDAFALNSAALTAAHLEEIKRLAWSIGLHAGMRRNAAATITIVGHTDRSGPETVNDPLGQNRADSVKQALVDALAKEGVDPATFGDIPSTSMGESQPVVPTADGVKNEKNRRVEITVNIGSKAAPAPPPPTFDPFKLPPDAVPPEGGPGPRREKDKWQEMEENQRKIEEYDRKHPRTNKGLSDILIDKVMDDIVDPIIKRLPVSKDLRDKARSAVRKGLEKGTEAACEAAVDAAGVTGAEAEALKAACKAALKEKGAGAGGRRP
jgi:outer membrane protein OmpA-like peptidoglycan-associated protein